MVRSLSGWIAVAVGLIVGIGWFSYSLTLAPAYRGLLCCDASEYLSFGSHGFLKALNHVSHRTFGYPFFLSAVALVAGTPGTQLVGALVLQLLCGFASSFFLAWSLVRCGFNFRPWMFAILLSNPALACIAGVSLTDSLGVSLFTCAISICLLVSYGQQRGYWYYLASGVVFGCLVAIRPVFLLMMPVLVFNFFVAGLRRGLSVRAVKATIIGVSLCGIGLAPFFLKLVHNCHEKFGAFCFIDPEVSGRSFANSFSYAFDFARYDGFVTNEGRFDWAPTLDPVFDPRCPLSDTNPVSSLSQCYQTNYKLLPRYFYSRLIGLFDVRYVNPYAALGTPVWVAWTNRAFSVFALLGVPILFGLLICQMIRRRPWEYLLLPVAYLMLQINFHVENRYIFPLIPISTSFALLALCNPRSMPRWVYAGLLLGAIALLVSFYVTVTSWDVKHIAQFGFL
jgi:hypothetical protein